MTKTRDATQEKHRPRRQRDSKERKGPGTQYEEPDLLALQRAVERPELASPADVLALQRTVGNRAVQRLLAPRQGAAMVVQRGGPTRERGDVKELIDIPNGSIVLGGNPGGKGVGFLVGLLGSASRPRGKPVHTHTAIKVENALIESREGGIHKTPILTAARERDNWMEFYTHPNGKLGDEVVRLANSSAGGTGFKYSKARAMESSPWLSQLLGLPKRRWKPKKGQSKLEYATNRINERLKTYCADFVVNIFRMAAWKQGLTDPFPGVSLRPSLSDIRGVASSWEECYFFRSDDDYALNKELPAIEEMARIRAMSPYREGGPGSGFEAW